MLSIWRKFYHDTRAATSIEYALIASLIAVAIIGSVTALGSDNGGIMDSTAQSVKNATKQ